jgi:hypothetical protein
MKSLSPWFQTAHLLNGIRKTVSEIEATRSTHLSESAEERRGTKFDRQARTPSQRPQGRV